MPKLSMPHCPQKGPYVKELKEGTYWWCACGLSKKQPFCDGSHQGTGISPIEYKVCEDSKIAFCGCKQSKTSPRCDGTHHNL